MVRGCPFPIKKNLIFIKLETVTENPCGFLLRLLAEAFYAILQHENYSELLKGQLLECEKKYYNS